MSCSLLNNLIKLKNSHLNKYPSRFVKRLHDPSCYWHPATLSIRHAYNFKGGHHVDHIIHVTRALPFGYLCSEAIYAYARLTNATLVYLLWIHGLHPLYVNADICSPQFRHGRWHSFEGRHHVNHITMWLMLYLSVTCVLRPYLHMPGSPTQP